MLETYSSVENAFATRIIINVTLIRWIYTKKKFSALCHEFLLRIFNDPS
jgi:hypothetical protein